MGRALETHWSFKATKCRPFDSKNMEFMSVFVEKMARFGINFNLLDNKSDELELNNNLSTMDKLVVCRW